MASVEVMKERARIVGRFNLSAHRNPEHRALVALAAQKAGGGSATLSLRLPAKMRLTRSPAYARLRADKPVIIVTEADGELRARLVNGGNN